MSLVLILAAIALMSVSGVPGLLMDPRWPAGQRIAAGLTTCGSIAGLIGAGMGMTGDAIAPLTLPDWFMGGGLTLAADALSALFLVPIFLVGALGSIYGLDYWHQLEHPRNGRKLRLFWGFLVAGMAILVIARHAMLFILGWEIMALSAFLLVGTEDHLAEVRKAAWLYLIATHVGTLSLFAMFGLMRLITGSFALRAIGIEEAHLGSLTVIFALALLGFGLKAGLMPLHFWLPSAHASAPSHVSAIMSGVVIKMGIYGLLRVLSFMPQPPVAWGGILLILGAVSGVLGVVFAIGQHDLKRLLAYHSVENIGIIVMGLGLAMIGRSLGRTDWIILGMAGCLLHVWNHALFKSLLFLGAGSVVHAVHTREIDELGGLAKRMPYTASLFLVGAVAICGLPPLNGFVSELLIYLGLLRTTGIGTGPSWSAAAVAVPVLATIGALAVACFVKVFGAVFLGSARTSVSDHAHESPPRMLIPMALLAGCCAAIGFVPVLFAPFLDSAIATWAGPVITSDQTLSSLVPLTTIGIMGLLLLVIVAAISTALWARMRGIIPTRTGTWDCGYARPSSRMQYTSSSFAASLVLLFRSVLHPRMHRPEIRGIMAGASEFESHVDDPVLERQLIPAAFMLDRWLAKFRTLQQGLIQHYILCILITVIVMLLWTTPLNTILARLFAR